MSVGMSDRHVPEQKNQNHRDPIPPCRKVQFRRDCPGRQSDKHFVYQCLSFYSDCGASSHLSALIREDHNLFNFHIKKRYPEQALTWKWIRSLTSVTLCDYPVVARIHVVFANNPHSPWFLNLGNTFALLLHSAWLAACAEGRSANVGACKLERPGR